jgi:hypothetical protein
MSHTPEISAQIRALILEPPPRVWSLRSQAVSTALNAGTQMPW